MCSDNCGICSNGNTRNCLNKVLIECPVPGVNKICNDFKINCPELSFHLHLPPIVPCMDVGKDLELGASASLWFYILYCAVLHMRLDTWTPQTIAQQESNKIFRFVQSLTIFPLRTRNHSLKSSGLLDAPSAMRQPCRCLCLPKLSPAARSGAVRRAEGKPSRGAAVL